MKKSAEDMRQEEAAFNTNVLGEGDLETNEVEGDITPQMSKAKTDSESTSKEQSNTISIDEYNKLKEDLANVRKGVNPLLDEIKSLKAQLQPKVDTVPNDDEVVKKELTERFGVATRDDIKAEIAALEKERRLNLEIDTLNLNKKAADNLKDLLHLESNKGLTPTEIAEKYGLIDMTKLEIAKQKEIFGQPVKHEKTKDWSDPESIDWNDDRQYKEFIRRNSNKNFI